MTGAIPTVYLLITLDSQTYALAVGEVLSKRFGITGVLVRSSQTPPDRLLDVTTGDENDKTAPRSVLFVVLGPSTSSTSVLETESSAPIITLQLNTDVNSTALSIAKCCAIGCAKLRQTVQKVVFANRQARLVQDAQWRTSSVVYTGAIAACYDHNQQIIGDKVNFPNRQRGKVRDRYELGGGGSSSENLIALVTTDRQSGFDRMLAQVPFKGAVLNLTSAFWFEKTKHIIPNHLVSVPHPYVTIARKCKPFPIEFVVRSYMTGSTSTSIWKNYQDGVRNYCGHALPDGMSKNQKLPQNLLTPTTKEEEHDRPISLADIVSENWMTQEDLDVCGKAALEIFALGQEIASEHGLILVDTKYEFGKDLETGEIRLIDEVHTPDSSRYWLASTYEQKMAQGQEPDNIDKEFLRLWFREHCDPYKDTVIPDAPRDLVLELARRYITLYEMITWKDFDFNSVKGEDAITEALKSAVA